MQNSKIKNQKCNLKFKTFAFCLVILTFYFCLLPLINKVHAQSLSLSLYPPLLEVTVKPGKSITQVYKLANDGETDLVVGSEILPFEPEDELGNIKLLTPKTFPSPTIDWFSFQNADLQLGQKFLLKAGQAQQVVLAIKIPSTAKEDDYYLTLLFETQPSDFNGGLSGTQAQAKIGANILLTISETGEPPRKAEIIEFKVQSAKLKVIDSFTPPQFVLRIKNTGRSFFKPMGIITTTGWFGQKYPLNLLPENILTKSTREIGCENDEETKICRLKAKFLLGPYEAKAEFGLDKVSSDYSARLIFIALPIKLFLIILGLIIFGIIVYFVKNRQFWQNKFNVSLDKEHKILSN